MTILTIKNPTEANAEAVDLLVRSMFSTVIHPSFGVYYVHGDAEGTP